MNPPAPRLIPSDVHPDAPQVSVIIPTHNPDAGRLRRTLLGLAAQTLPRRDWELIVVDNGSSTGLSVATEPLFASMAARLVPEPSLGLTSARLAGFRVARGEVLVLVDDDNVLAPTYLAAVAQHFANSPTLAAAGGPVVAEWESPPPDWTREFHGLLALRDLGPDPLIARGGPHAGWPNFAPVGAGLAIRRDAALSYARMLATDSHRRTLDRTGASLSSGGDNDLVFNALHAGGDVAYFPDLHVTHLIPNSRLTPAYLARLNEGVQRSWVRVLAIHGQLPWSSIAPWTAPIRAARAWLRTAAWRTPAHHIRWRGLVGRFLGQADLHRAPFASP